MSFIFGKRKTPAELLRENKRMLDKSIREIERERQGLQAQEKKLILEIKKSAKQGQMSYNFLVLCSVLFVTDTCGLILTLNSIGDPMLRQDHINVILDGLPDDFDTLSCPSLSYQCTVWTFSVIRQVNTTDSEGAVRVMAKDLVRTRHQVEKFYKLKSQLQGVSLRIQTLKSTQAMGEAMKGVTKAMGQMNRQMNLPSLQKIMQEFERQNEKMELTSEMMGDAIDDALEGEEDEEETEDLVSQVLDEIGIDINQELVNAPSSAVAAPAAKTKVAQVETTGNDDGGGIDSDLQARLDNLRKM
ncbi:hypothetical protein ACSQ67_020089 [Phaseolus vulgaris]